MFSLTHSLRLKKGGVIGLVGAGGKTTLMFHLARELSRQGAAVLTTTTTKIYMPTRKQSSAVIVAGCVKAVLHQARTYLKHHRHISAGSRTLHIRHKLIGFPPDAIDDIWQSAIFDWIIVEADGAAGRPVKAPAAHEPVIPKCAKWVVAVVGLEAVGKPLTARWAFRPQLVSQITGLTEGSILTEAAVAQLLMDENGILKNAPAGAIKVAFLNQADSQDRLESGRKIAQMLVQKQKLGFAGVLIGQTLYEPMVKNIIPSSVHFLGQTA
jgi:probable selenium-dependent hydroxylase accessory protein YqeC